MDQSSEIVKKLDALTREGEPENGTINLALISAQLANLMARVEEIANKAS